MGQVTNQPAGASNCWPELFNVGARKRIMRNMWTNVRPSRKYCNYCQLLHLGEFAYERIYYLHPQHSLWIGGKGVLQNTSSHGCHTASVHEFKSPFSIPPKNGNEDTFRTGNKHFLKAYSDPQPQVIVMLIGNYTC